MFSCHYYWLFAPLRGGVIDTPDREPAFTLPIQSADLHACELSLYCDEHGAPIFARCRIPNLATEHIPEAQLPLLQSLREHLLSILRMTYRPDVMLAEPSTVFAFIKDGNPPEVKLEIQEFAGTRYDPTPTKHLFIQSFDLREVVRLYVDGCDARIPIQYRYLSLYKLLELRYRKNGYWNRKELAELLAPYAEEFAKRGFKVYPMATLHELRDKCAHIKTGAAGKRELLGVTHLNLAQVARVEKALPVLRAACAASINQRSAGKFSLRADVVEDRFQAVEGDA